MGVSIPPNPECLLTRVYCHVLRRVLWPSEVLKHGRCSSTSPDIVLLQTVQQSTVMNAVLRCAVRAALSCSEVLKYGRYRGFTSLGIVFQTMDNTHLRRALGMKAHQTGVLINRIQPTTSTAKVRRQDCSPFELMLLTLECISVQPHVCPWCFTSVAS
jgi:hypothetical protein